MTTLTSHQPEPAAEPRASRAGLLVPEMWAALAIAVMWLAVLADAFWGPDIVSNSAGMNFTRIPSAVVLGFFAWLATWVIARHAFGRRGDADS